MYPDLWMNFFYGVGSVALVREAQFQGKAASFTRDPSTALHRRALAGVPTYRYRLRGFVKLTFKGSIEADRKATLADTWMVVLVMHSRWASSLAVEPCSSPFGHDHGMSPALLWGTT